MSVAKGLRHIVVVGLLAIGAILANLLATYNLRVAVVERAPMVYDKPRAITVDYAVP